MTTTRDRINSLARSCTASHSFYASEADCAHRDDVGWYYEVGSQYGGDDEAMKRGAWRPNDNSYGPFDTKIEADADKLHLEESN